MPVLFVHTVLLVVPGLLLAAALGVRGWALAATSPLATYAIVAAAGTVCTFTGLRWGPATFAGAVVVFVGLALLARRLWFAPPADAPSDAPPDPWAGWRGWAVVGAAVVGAAVGTLVLFDATHGLTVPPQDWDAPFHANATRFIADTGDADPSALSFVNRYESTEPYYYPNGWHLFTALVHDVTGAPIHVVFDVSIVSIAPLLTVGLVGLLRTLGARPALAAVTALLSNAASALPYDLILRGPLITYGTGVVLVPAFLVLLHRAITGRSVAAAVLCAASAAALQVVHPGAAIVAAVFAIALVAQRWASLWRADRGAIVPDLRMLGLTALVAAVLAAPALIGSYTSVAEAAVFFWPADQPAAWAFGDVVGFAHLSEAPRWALTIGLLLGLTALRPLRPVWWLLAGSAVFATLFVLAASYQHPLISQLTRPWWGDKWRLIAVATIGAIVLAAHGVVVLADVLARRLPRFAPAALVLVVAAVAWTTSGFYAEDDRDRLRGSQFGDGPGLTRFEQQAIEALPRFVPPGAMVMNQNSDGSAWMYSMTGIKPVNGHIEVARVPADSDLSRRVTTIDPPPPGPDVEVFTMSDAQMLLHKRFNRIDTDPEVRATVERLNVQYVIVGRGHVRTWFRRAEGLRGLESVRSLELVYENPDARIYRVLPAADTSS